MPPKSKSLKSMTDAKSKSSTYDGSDTLISPRCVSLTLTLEGDPPGPGDWPFMAIFFGQIVLEGKWKDGRVLESEELSLDLKALSSQQLVSDLPLILLLRTVGGKGAKDPDPLLNSDNRAGATVDLFPLVMGEEEVKVSVPLVNITTGELTTCTVEAYAKSAGVSEIFGVPLTLTLLSAHCLPYAREGTVYLAAIGLNEVLEEPSVKFGMSLSSATASKVVWATASNGGQAANTVINVPREDLYIPPDIEVRNSDKCVSVYWNAMKRILVDPMILSDRLATPFMIEVAGVPRTGKIDVRGRYMGFVDAGALLEPGEYGVTVCARLLFYNEANLPENVGPLLELPPSSAKVSARETDLITDEFGHDAYIIIRFDITEPVIPKVKFAWLYETLGFPAPEGPAFPVDALEIESPREDPSVDVRRIRKESGALAVHKELSTLACRGAVPMNQGIKRTAANRLLMRVRTMLKQFPPGDCSLVDWQDTVTAQHAASRRAVTASFAPQPPARRATSRVAAARCRLAGDTRLADIHVENNLKVLKNHPRPLLTKVLRLLEENKTTDAKNCLLEAVSVHTRNKFLLWTLGAQEFNEGPEGFEVASAAFRIAIKGDCSDGTTNAIGWAALHALYHSKENYTAAYVAAKKMRKSFELPKEWKLFHSRWTTASGEEETYWLPSTVSSENPILMAAAFFLCLRCYAFSELLLKCYEENCATRGSRLGLKPVIGPDLYYIRAASHLIRRELDKALEVTTNGLKRFGPSAMMSQMRATCLAVLRGWDGECESALVEAEKAGAEPCPALLLKAAESGAHLKPYVSLQRAARVHKIAPSAFSALVIARIYNKMGEDLLAERWAAAAVKMEPRLADGWAFLALLAMYQRDVHRARTMLRTAKQVGPLSPEVEDEIKKVMDIIQVETLPDALVKNLCLCDYY